MVHRFKPPGDQFDQLTGRHPQLARRKHTGAVLQPSSVFQQAPWLLREGLGTRQAGVPGRRMGPAKFGGTDLRREPVAAVRIIQGPCALPQGFAKGDGGIGEALG